MPACASRATSTTSAPSRTTPTAAGPPRPRLGLAAAAVAGLIGVAIVLTGLNLRTAVTERRRRCSRSSSGACGISSRPGRAGHRHAGPLLRSATGVRRRRRCSARFRDAARPRRRTLAMARRAGACAACAAAPVPGSFLAATVLTMAGGAAGQRAAARPGRSGTPRPPGLLVGGLRHRAESLGRPSAAVAAAADRRRRRPRDGWRLGARRWAVAGRSTPRSPGWPCGPTPGASRAVARRRPACGTCVHSRAGPGAPSSSASRRCRPTSSIGWSAQYLRDSGISAATAVLLLGAIGAGPRVSALVPALAWSTGAAAAACSASSPVAGRLRPVAGPARRALALVALLALGWALPDGAHWAARPHTGDDRALRPWPRLGLRPRRHRPLLVGSCAARPAATAGMFVSSSPARRRSGAAGWRPGSARRRRGGPGPSRAGRGGRHRVRPTWLADRRRRQDAGQRAGRTGPALRAPDGGSRCG